MANVDLVYSEVLNAVQNASVGSSVKGYTLVSRTYVDGTWRVVIAKAQNTWAIDYFLATLPSPACRVMSVTDDQGQPFWPAPWVDGWV